MQAVKSLSSYHAVVAGSAIQNAQWLPEAMRFIQVQQRELVKRPERGYERVEGRRPPRLGRDSGLGAVIAAFVGDLIARLPARA